MCICESVCVHVCNVFHGCCLVCSDEDDTAELLKELQRIKRERAEEQAQKVWFLSLSLSLSPSLPLCVCLQST